MQLITLFSAGGEDNKDLPEKSNYRRVRPMALTIRHQGGLDGKSELDAWRAEIRAGSLDALDAIDGSPSDSTNCPIRA